MERKFGKQLIQFLGDSPSLELTPENTALISVDLQYFDAHPDWGEGKTSKDLGVEHLFDEYYEQLDRAIPNVQKLLDLFRKKQMEVIHLVVSEWTNDSRDVGYKQLVRGLIVPADTKEAELLEEVVSVGDEIIVKKSSSGVFPVTNIDRLLRNMDIKTLVFVGTSTGGCVESAVRDAVDLGYNVVVVSDACAAGTEKGHELALWRMKGGLTYILSTQEVVDRLKKLPDNNRKAKSGLERVKPYLPKPTKVEGDVDPYSVIFPPAIEQDIRRDNTVLAVVDVQRFTCDPEVGIGADESKKAEELKQYYNRVEAALPSIQKAIRACRQAGIPVMFFRISGKSSNGRDMSRKFKELGVQFGPDSAEARWMEGLEPNEGDFVFNKPASGIYTGTGLDEVLRNMQIENLIFTGVSFDGAVEGSIRSATDRGYCALILKDAIATYHERLQDGIDEMEVGVIRTKATEEFIKFTADL